MTAAPQPPTPLGAMDRYRVWAPSAVPHPLEETR